LSCSTKMELNLMRSIYGKESAAPRGACLAGIPRSRGCAPRCGASPRAIALSAPPAPNINAETPGAACGGDAVSNARAPGADKTRRDVEATLENIEYRTRNIEPRKWKRLRNSSFLVRNSIFNSRSRRIRLSKRDRERANCMRLSAAGDLTI
jgi:hypothetical protein